MRYVIWMLAAATAAGCTTVRLEQREGCWVRQTEKWGRVTEEIGPCARPAPAWVDDRATRLVQECVADAGWRWQNEALDAWNRREPLPDRPDDAATLESCMAESARTVIAEKESLELRLDGALADKERFISHNERLADVLGEAAKKPAGTATATANASGDGHSSSTNDSKSSHAADLTSPPPVAAPAPIIVPLPAAPAPEVKVVTITPKTAPAPRPKPVVATKPVPQAPICEPDPQKKDCEWECR